MLRRQQVSITSHHSVKQRNADSTTQANRPRRSMAEIKQEVKRERIEIDDDGIGDDDVEVMEQRQKRRRPNAPGAENKVIDLCGDED